ncbi:MAG: SDR family oxidoreductase [Bacteroidota bacterium]|jgi:UDP-glucose 4-epimerase
MCEIKNKNILITGCSGFLGSKVAEIFKLNGNTIYGIDKNNIDKEKETFFDSVIQAEVTTNNLSSFNTKFDIIVHCAGSSSVRFSFENPDADYQMTVGSTIEVLNFIKESNRDSILIYPSSAAVYGNAIQLPIKETSELKPISPYGQNKLIVENLCKENHNNYNTKILIIRFFSLYGAGLRKQLLWDACNKFHNSDNPSFFGTGNEVRDWLNIRDAVQIIYKFSESDFEFMTINGASGNGTTNKEIISMISNHFGKKSFSFTGEVPAGDPLNLSADTQLLNSYGFKSEVSLDKGIIEYVDWYKKINSLNTYK